MMKMSERDPYAPPRSEVEVSPDEVREWEQQRVEKVLRWVGAACLGSVMVRSVFGGSFQDFLMRSWIVCVWGGLMVGFLFRGRRWHLGIAIFMLLCVMGQVGVVKVLAEVAERGRTPVLPRVWWGVAASVVAYVVTMVCGVMLFVRGRRRRVVGSGEGS